MLPLKWILGRWLQKEAQTRAVKAVREAAARAHSAPRPEQTQQQHCQEPGEPQETPAADLAFLFGLPLEADALVRRLSGLITHRAAGRQIHLGQHGSRRVAITASGAGRQRATRTASAIIAAHRPALVVCCGLAGGLAPTLRRNDLVLASALCSEGNEPLEIQLPSSPPNYVKIGPLLTVDRIIRTTAEKESLATKFGAVAVDMESYHVAQECRRAAVPFVALRVISDAVEDELPADVDRLMHQKTLASKAGALAGTLFNRPGSAKDMWRLKEVAFEAAERLADGIVSLMLS